MWNFVCSFNLVLIVLLQGIGEEIKPVGRGKRSASIRNSYEKKCVKPQDRTSSSNNMVDDDESAPSTAATQKEVNLPTKVRSRRKIVTEKPLTIDDVKKSEILVSEKFLIIQLCCQMIKNHQRYQLILVCGVPLLYVVPYTGEVFALHI